MIQNHDIRSFLINKGAEFIDFVDISSLSEKQNKGFSIAILFGITLSPQYLKKVSLSSNYVEEMKKNNAIKEDEFFIKEQKTDSIADSLAYFLTTSGYNSYSQSEANIENTGFYNTKTKSTPLPHKTIAVMAGLGWIGKHNLLVTPNYGSAFSMCSVLTNAPLITDKQSSIYSNSLCGTCEICQNICQKGALNGINWNMNTSRDKIIDVFKCSPCLKCMIHCPYTQKYINQNL